MSTYYPIEIKAILPPKLIITLCGTLQVQAVFEECSNNYICVETSQETLMEQLLKINVHGMYTIEGTFKEETLVGVDGNNECSKTVKLKSINRLPTKSDKILLLLLYKHAINNYYNKDLVIAYAPLELVKQKFDKLWNLLSPLTTFKSVEPKMYKNMKKECEEHATKSLELVDKFTALCFSSNQA